jgi:hypothetical protein
MTGRCSARYRQTSRTDERAGKKSRSKDCGKPEETGDFLFIDQYKWK